MEILLRRRTPLRASFTKLFNKLKLYFEDKTVQIADIQSKLDSLERIKSTLSEIDMQILEILLTDETKIENYNDEFERVEQYNEQYDEIRARANIILQKAISDQEINANIEKVKLKLPQIELSKFGGEVKDWLSFWSQFNRIHEDKHMESEDKFQYLIQCMTPGTRAKEIIDSYPPTAENYLKAVESLKNRFGREELLIEFYVRELLGLVAKNIINMKSKTNIMQLYDKLESHLRSLESIGMTSDKYAAMLFPLVESCIPEDILRVWLRNPSLNEEDKSYSGKLSQLLLFLRAEVEGEERINLAKIGIKQNDSGLKQKKFPQLQEFEVPVPTANDLMVSSKVGHKSKCVFCDKIHLSKDCFYGQKLSYEEKLNLLKNKKCCYTCLKIGHISKNCKTNVRCKFCDKRHFIILCPDFKKKSKIPSKVEFPRKGKLELSDMKIIISSQKAELDVFKQENDILKEKISVMEIEFQEENSNLKSQMAQQQRQHVQQDLVLTRLHREMKQKEDKIVEIEKKMNRLKLNYEDIVKELKSEKKKNSELVIELQKNEVSLAASSESQVKMAILKKEIDVWKEISDKLIKSAFNLEKEKSSNQCEEALKEKISKLEEKLVLEVKSKSDLQKELVKEKDRFSEKSEECLQLQESCNKMEKKIEELEEKLDILKSEDIDFDELDEALTLHKLKNQKAVKLSLDKVSVDELKDLKLRKGTDTDRLVTIKELSYLKKTLLAQVLKGLNFL